MVGNVTSVNLNDRGDISCLAVSLDSDIIRVDGRLFIDCTGFKRVLSSNFRTALIDCSDYIPCNSAIATHLPEVSTDRHQWTHATALSSGWTWRIPLRDRTGIGYVYSDRFISERAAEKELAEFWDRKLLEETKWLKWKPAFAHEAWVNNCVAIGLSSGFLEPLEATMIHTILFQSTLLLDLLFRSNDSQVGVDLTENSILSSQFNEKIRDNFANLVSYIGAHYLLSRRRSSEFWRSLHDFPPPDDVRCFFEAWKRSPSQFHEYCTSVVDRHCLFKALNWIFMFKGMNY